MLTPRTLDVQQLKLRLWDHERAGPSVLFVHGYLDTGRSFDTVCDALPELHCLALDLRGHGQSDRVGAGGSYHLLDHMKDVAIVLDMLKPDLLVGHSMGGNIAILVAGAAPRLVQRLLLLDSCGAPPEDPEDAPARLGELLESVLKGKRPFSSAQSIEDAAEKIRVQNPGLSSSAAMRMVAHVMEPNDDGTLRFPFDPRLRGPSPLRWPEAMWTALCQRLSMPVSVVRATNGYVPEGETLDARMGAMADADLRTIDGPHHLHVEKPSEVAIAVRALIARNRDRPA